MSQKHESQTESTSAPAAGGGGAGERHWQHRGSTPIDPVQYSRWCTDRLVQMMAAPIGGDTTAAVHTAAQQGIAEPGAPLPHLDRIQASFGPGHDVSNVQAHVGGAAATASAQMGAQAYATGDHVAFAAAPDVHLAAHEAAHTVQQRAGVQLSGGVGAEGDAYERNADAVADRVVAGQSAADLLPGGASAVATSVQHKAHAPHHEEKKVEDEADEADEHVEADEEEGDAGASNKTLAPGKPPGAVQKKVAANGGGAAHAAKRGRALSIQEATARYAPLVWLAKGETDRPGDASEYIKNSRLRWSHDAGHRDDAIEDTGDVNERRLGDGGYSDRVTGDGIFDGKRGREIHSDEDCRPADGKGAGGNEGFFLDLDNSKHKSLGRDDAPVYYEAVAGHYITYWFFYAYNSGPVKGGIDNHEGDWERIVVKLDKRNRATRIAYYQHEGHEEKSWKDAPKTGSHPIVFSGKGSHASYTSEGSHNIPLPVIPDSIVKDHTSKGSQWKTWKNMKNAQAQDWYGYGGAWGEVGNWEHSTGPQGPSKHKAAAPKGW